MRLNSPTSILERPTTNMKRLHFLLLLFILPAALCLSAPYTGAQQDSNPKAARLIKIEFAGLNRYSREEAIEASGLRIGQNVDEPTLDAAANRLMGSGLFAKLSYRYRTTNDQAVVTFTVEETKGSIPVVFDNFVWFSDEEILNAVRQEMPTFEGAAPDSGGALDSITKALQRLLKERKIPDQIDYMPEASPTGEAVRHIFSVRGLNMPVCALRFPGASNVQESVLIKNSKPLLSNPYSRKFVAEFARENLIPIYRQRGHLRASFKTPSSTLAAASGGDCKDGVSVSLPVEEGLAYTWDKAEWDGNQTIPAQELEKSLGMKSGELADGVKFDSGLDIVRGAYGKKGFVGLRLTLAPDFDDAGRRVIYRIKLDEGSQYHMGNLMISGLSESDTRRLKEKWKLQPGDVYDATYLRDFVKEVIFKGGVGGAGKRVENSYKLDRQKLTVDVSIDFK
jgi:outer membrane protein assembly factor BamA